MTQTIIHVGLHKTGTTWIQRELFDTQQKYQVVYEPVDYTMLHDGRPLLISYEGLSGCPYYWQYPKGVNVREQIARNLHHMFPDARILLGTRNIDSWVKSLYSQAVKSGEVCLYDEFQHRLHTINKQFLDIDKYITVLCELFEEVHLYKFEMLQENPNEFVSDICRFLDIPIPSSLDFKPRNKKLTPHQLQMYRQLNRLCHSPVHPGIIPHTFLKRMVKELRNE